MLGVLIYWGKIVLLFFKELDGRQGAPFPSCCSQQTIEVGEAERLTGAVNFMDLFVTNYQVMCHIDVPSNPLATIIRGRSKQLVREV